MILFQIKNFSFQIKCEVSNQVSPISLRNGVWRGEFTPHDGGSENAPYGWQLWRCWEVSYNLYDLHISNFTLIKLWRHSSRTRISEENVAQRRENQLQRSHSSLRPISSVRETPVRTKLCSPATVVRQKEKLSQLSQHSKMTNTSWLMLRR